MFILAIGVADVKSATEKNTEPAVFLVFVFLFSKG